MIYLNRCRPVNDAISSSFSFYFGTTRLCGVDSCWYSPRRSEDRFYLRISLLFCFTRLECSRGQGKKVVDFRLSRYATQTSPRAGSTFFFLEVWLTQASSHSVAATAPVAVVMELGVSPTSPPPPVHVWNSSRREAPTGIQWRERERERETAPSAVLVLGA